MKLGSLSERQSFPPMVLLRPHHPIENELAFSWLIILLMSRRSNPWVGSYPSVLWSRLQSGVSDFQQRINRTLSFIYWICTRWYQMIDELVCHEGEPHLEFLFSLFRFFAAILSRRWPSAKVHFATGNGNKQRYLLFVDIQFAILNPPRLPTMLCHALISCFI